MTTSSMKEFRVDYNTPGVKETFNVTVLGYDIEDARARFDRITRVFQSGNPNYDATIRTITERKKARD